MSACEAPVIDAFALASERGVIRGEFPFACLPRLADMLVESTGTLAYAIEGRIDDEGRPGATMQLQAGVVLRCQRCNSPVNFRLERTALFRFSAGEDEVAARPIEDDEFEDIVASHRMDVASWVEDEAILSLPVVPRHEACSPPASDVLADGCDAPHPFAALAALKAGRRGN